MPYMPHFSGTWSSNCWGELAKKAEGLKKFKIQGLRKFKRGPKDIFPKVHLKFRGEPNISGGGGGSW